MMYRCFDWLASILKAENRKLKTAPMEPYRIAILGHLASDRWIERHLVELLRRDGVLEEPGPWSKLDSSEYKLELAQLRLVEAEVARLVEEGLVRRVGSAPSGGMAGGEDIYALTDDGNSYMQLQQVAPVRSDTENQEPTTENGSEGAHRGALSATKN